MANTRKVLGVALALLIGVGAISGCTKDMNVTNPGPQNPGTTDSNTKPGSNTGSTNTTAKAQTGVVQDLASYQEDEAAFADSETLAQSKFTTKAILDNIGSGEVKITETLKDKLPEDTKVNADTKAKVKVKLDTLVQNQTVKKDLEAAGAITVAADGTVTVDKAKLKVYLDEKKAKLQAFLKANEAAIKKHVDEVKVKLKADLEANTDLDAAKVEELKNKKNKVRTSNTTTTTNADGSITETVLIRFTSPNGQVTRENTISKTTKDGKNVKIEHLLSSTTPAFTKTATRIVVFNADGTRTVTTGSVTTFVKDGRKREVNEQRTVGGANGTGAATGSGTLTLTDATGKATTYNLVLDITANGKLTTSTTNPETNTEVKVEQEATGEAKATVTEEGQAAKTETVDIAAASEVDASASATTTAS